MFVLRNVVIIIKNLGTQYQFPNSGGKKKLDGDFYISHLRRWLEDFNVHSRVRAKTKTEAERVGKYMIRPLLSLERLDYLEFIARVTSHIPDQGQVTVRYFGPLRQCPSRKDQEGEP